MIRFVKESGETFDGVYPYIHWIEGQLSVGLWYTVKLMFVSDQRILQTSELPEDSIYKFITPNIYDPSYEGVNLDLSTISTRSITSIGTLVQFDGSTTNWYIHQILLVCKGDNPGEYIESFNIGNDLVAVGVDLYDLDETLQINLENRGLELPLSIQKAFLETDINESDLDYALLNRKFKELVSNFIDIVDCKGSYKSLYNSLKWFEWGENTKLYEVWKGDNMYIEKELKPILSNIYFSFLSTYNKTTHLSLVTAVQEMSKDTIIVDPSDPDFDDRNPQVRNVISKWTNDELALKTSLLGLFFERYFMPIHLDLKRACIECLINTNQIKVLSGSHTHKFNYHEDVGVINIQMDHTVTLGNIRAVAVGKDTVFGITIDRTATDPNIKSIYPIGVDYIKDIDQIAGTGIVSEDFNFDYNDDFAIAGSDMNGVAQFYLQLKSGVGVVVPVTVKIKLPQDDSIKTEYISVYRYRDGQEEPIISQTTDHRLYTPSEDGYVNFTFNLVSTQEEKVSFTMMLVSTSGHVWTAASSYEAVDPSGSYLDIYKVSNISTSFANISDWISNNKFVFYESQFSPYNDPNDSSEKRIIQYIPYNESDSSLFNQLIVIQNIYDQDHYVTDWMSDPTITSNFWVMSRSAEWVVKSSDEVLVNSGTPGTTTQPKYAVLIAKTPGKVIGSKTEFINLYGGLIGNNFRQSNIKRFELIYISQLQKYENIETHATSLADYTFSQSDLLCVVPQFRRTLARVIDQSSVFWEYENKTTLKKIRTHIPTQTPLVTDNESLLLSPGYWTISMYYKLSGSSEVHKLTKNSAFKIH